MRSRSEEDYLKAIYSLWKDENPISTTDIANYLNMKASSVTDMLQKLSDKGWINYIKYKGATLTKEGKKIALSIIRKHRLWETFLVTNLNFKWDEVHEIAEQLEHINSSELVNRLDDYLGNPMFDPHGDPIPNINGKIPKSFSIPLIELPINKIGQVVGVSLDTPSFLQYLDKINIHLGTKIKVADKIEFDQSLEIIIDNKNIQISSAVAKNILINTK